MHTNPDREPVLVGTYQTEYVKNPEQTTLHFILDSIAGIVGKYSLKPHDIDGLSVSSFLMGPDNTTTVAEQVGITARWTHQGNAGGAAHIAAVLDTARAIQHGYANTVVISSADSYSVARHKLLMNNFNSSMRDFIAPSGFGGTNGLFAMLQRRHMHEYGTTREQLAKLSVVQRHNASLNENALLRSELSVEDYLDCRMIADPIGLYDCVLPCGGGESTLLTTRAKAEEMGWDYLKILSGDYRVNYVQDTFLTLRGGWADFSGDLFKTAGLEHKDIDVVGLYDDYPIMELIQLEGLGFCPEGEGGRWLEDTDISVTGETPINTGGGQLSCGQAGAAGGAIALTEAVKQLQSEVEEGRQVPNAETAVISGFGMIGFGKGLGESALIIARKD